MMHDNEASSLSDSDGLMQQFEQMAETRNCFRMQRCCLPTHLILLQRQAGHANLFKDVATSTCLMYLAADISCCAVATVFVA